MNAVHHETEQHQDRPDLRLGSIVWPVVFVVSLACAVLGLLPQLLDLQVSFIIADWPTGAYFVAAAILITIGQLFIQQYFEVGRMKAQLLSQLESDQAEGDRLIAALEARVADANHSSPPGG